MGQSLLMTVCRRRSTQEALTASISASDHPLFSAEDEALLACVAAHFVARGCDVERDIGPTYDSLWITPAGSINPTWIIVRQHDSGYQLQDGLLGIEKQGHILEEVLLPEWLAPA